MSNSSPDKQIEQLVETQSLPCPPGSTDVTVSTDGLVDLLTPPSHCLGKQPLLTVFQALPVKVRNS